MIMQACPVVYLPRLARNQRQCGSPDAISESRILCRRHVVFGLGDRLALQLPIEGAGQSLRGYRNI